MFQIMPVESSLVSGLQEHTRVPYLYAKLCIGVRTHTHAQNTEHRQTHAHTHTSERGRARIYKRMSDMSQTTQVYIRRVYIL